jgi:hypothetical protein
MSRTWQCCAKRSTSAPRHGASAKTAHLPRYTNCDLLIVDELGYVPCDSDAADLLFRIVSNSTRAARSSSQTNLAYKHVAQSPESLAAKKTLQPIQRVGRSGPDRRWITSRCEALQTPWSAGCHIQLMKQVVRNLTDVADGFLRAKRYLSSWTATQCSPLRSVRC